MLNVQLLKILLKDEQFLQTEVKKISVPWTRNRFSLILNGVLENVLVCAQFS